MCSALEAPTSFWQAGTLSQADRLRWYSEFGGVDLSIPGLPEIEPAEPNEEFIAGEEDDERKDRGGTSTKAGSIELRSFQGIDLPPNPPPSLTIESVYRADITASAHRLHDQMVLLIAQTCMAKGAAVFDDPSSVDLLVVHEQKEFIIEVKSVTQRNFMARLRYAIGQVVHYDFLRAQDTHLPRRMVLAFAAVVPSDSWTVAFLNKHLSMDLLTLEAGGLKVYSPTEQSEKLFG